MRRLTFTIGLIALLALSFANIVPARAGSAIVVTNLTTSVTTVAGGKTVYAAVQISSSAPTGGLVVALSSGNTSRATVPATVTVAAGSRSGNVVITTLAVTSNASVTVTAAAGGASKSLTLNLTPSKLTTLTVPSTLIGTTKGTGQLALDGTAPSGGLAVTLSNSNSAAAGFKLSVTIPAGASTAAFTITAAAVTTNQQVTVTATLGSVVKSKTISITPPLLARVSFSPSTVVGGKTSTGTVNLSQAAPSGGAIVALSSSAPNVFAVPASVTVPAGATSKTFTGTSETGFGQTVVTVTGSYRGVRTTTVTVTPGALGVASLTLSPSPIGSQSPLRATIRLTGVAPTGGTAVTISSSNASLVPVAGNYTVPAGQDTLIVNATTGTVSADAFVSVTATASGQAKTTSLTIKPWALLSVDLPSPTVVSYNTISGTIMLTGPAPSGGASVKVFTTNVNVLPVPVSVLVPAGSSSATFQVTGKKVDSNFSARVTAQGGGVSSFDTVTVVPLQVVEWGSFASRTSGGLPVDTTITLNGLAPAGGSAVVITSSRPTISIVPATITVPAGQNVGNLRVNTDWVTSDTNTTITATLGPAATLTHGLEVRPPYLSTLDVSASPMLHKLSYTGTVTLTGPAYPSGGSSITLSSSNPSVASVPSSVLVQPRAVSTTFTISTSTVATPQSVTFTATYRGTTRTIQVLVVPVGPWGSGSWFSPGWSSDTNVTFSLTGPVETEALVFSASYGACITGPATVTIPEGATSVSVPVRGIPGVNWSSSLLTVTANGLTATANASCPVATASLTLSQTQIKGGLTFTATVGYNVAAPTGGFTTEITSDTPGVIADIPVTIPAGSTGGVYTLTTVPVGTNTAVKLQVAGSSGSPQRTITVQAPRVTTVGIAPASVTGPAGATGTVTLDAFAPAGGFVVTLSSSNTAAATVPASVTVSAGATTATFAVTTKVVANDTTVTITATANAQSASGQITVTEPIVQADLGGEEIVELPATPVATPEPVVPEATPAAEPTPAPTEPATAAEPTPDATAPADPTAAPTEPAEPVVEETETPSPEAAVADAPADGTPVAEQ